MKNIYVTIAEFIQNNGNLIKGRQLFAENLFSKEIELVGTYVSTENVDCITYEKQNGTEDEDGDEYLYVQINCTPHYI